METRELVFTILGAVFVLWSAYGALKMNRRNFLMGIFLFSLLPIVGEYLAYAENGAWGHLATMLAFLGVAIVALPIKAQYGSDNVAATAIARKVGVAIISLNLFQAYIILSVRDDVPSQFGYFHIALAAIVIFTVAKTNSKQGFTWQ